MKDIKRILIANRGEIAIRVMASCQAMGIESIAIYAQDDETLPHALKADIAVPLIGDSLAETYLNQDRIIEIAKEYQADAIHPGYGFLSENAAFSKKVKDNGIIFIGPSEDVITLMGDKTESKKTMEKIGAPLIPGYHGDNQDSSFLKDEAKKIGYPVLIKASAGGGGKGMRVVETEADFEMALDGAKSEAKKAFGNDHVLIEKYITLPRHIEVQVLSDQHGGHFHFYERECSIQRRHQKIVEETPSTSLNPSEREDICTTAVNIAREIGYEGAGTIEFILDTDGKFYFLEMNTRLQVEHPVTEKVTGVDLVALQIRVARGEKLDFTQEDVTQRGHSIEVRIYAEDPDNNFLPTTGKIEAIGVPAFTDTRLDCGYVNGNEVTINYDPMIAKLIVHASSREQATNKLLIELDNICFHGVKTNRDYLRRILRNENFKTGKTYTNFVVENESDLERVELTPSQIAAAVAAQYFGELDTRPVIAGESAQRQESWDILNNFRNV